MGLSTEGLSTQQHETHGGNGSWDENKNHYWHGGSHTVMWEWSLRNWHILPCSAVSCESLRRVYRRISPPFLTHGLFIVAVVRARTLNLLQRSHTLACFSLSPPMCARLLLWPLHPACLHIVHRWRLTSLERQTKPKRINYSFSVCGGGKTCISKKDT